MAPESQIVLPVSSLAHDGRGIGFLPAPEGKKGKAVFISGALPGQTIACQPIKEKKNYIEASLSEIINEDGSLLAPICPHATVCGGCSLQRLPYEKQIYWKENLAKSAFTRVGGFSEDLINRSWRGCQPSPFLAGFRNRVTLAFGRDENGLALGFRAGASHAVFNLKACALAPPSIQPIISSCRDLAASSPAFADGYPRFLILRQTRTLADPALAWHALLITGKGDNDRRKAARKLGESLLARNPGLASFIHEERRANDYWARGDQRIAILGNAGSPPALELGGKIFEIDPASFFQVNSQAAEILAAKAEELYDRKTGGSLLDVYCGVGAPGQLLEADSCLGIEADKKAIACARANAKRYNLRNWRYDAGEAANALSRLAKKGEAWQTALLDPPRQGMSEKAIAALLKIAPERLIYVSCNPVTMARDIKALSGAYTLEGLHGIDMFPHTPHSECVGILTRP